MPPADAIAGPAPAPSDRMTASGKRYPTTSLCLGYGVGSSGVAILLNTVSVYFPTLMATVLGMDPAIAGALLMGSKIYDAFADVIIGASSDKLKAKYGRRPFLFAGAVISFLSLLMIFVAPVMGKTETIVYMAVALVIYSTGYSLFNVPYLAMPAEITRGSRERLKLISFRTAAIGLGQLTALALSAWLIDVGGGGAGGYRTMGLIMAVLALVTMMIAFFTVRFAVTEASTGSTHALTRKDFASLLQNRPLFTLLGAKLCQYIAFGVLMPINLLFLLNVMSLGYMGMIHLAVVQNLAVFASQPAWTRIGRKLGKRKAYLLAQAIMIPVVMSWYWADATTGVAGVWWRGAVFGFASGGALLMSTSMLPDTIEYDRLKNGVERGGVFAGLYAVNEKVGFAIGAAVLGFGLSLAGYVATTGGAIVQQSAATISALYGIKTTAPAVMLCVGVILLLFYNLDEARLDAMRSQKADD